MAGIVLIVGLAVAGLLAAGLLGSQGGGEGIRGVTLLPPPTAGGHSGIEVGPGAGELAPDFEVSAFDGSRHRLSDFRGKVVLLDFWASWCLFCQLELPEMYKLQQRHPDELVVVAVNRREPLDRARDYLGNITLEDRSKGVSFTIDGIDPDDTLYAEYKALGMPASFFIDTDGVIRHVANGPILLPQMEEALADTQGRQSVNTQG